MKSGLKIIKEDTFNVVKRLKQINPNYELVYNTKLQRFELYTNNLKNLELVFSQTKIDKRMIDYVQKTRIENIDKLIKQIDEENAKLEMQNDKTLKNEAIDKIKEVIEYDSKRCS